MFSLMMHMCKALYLAMDFTKNADFSLLEKLMGGLGWSQLSEFQTESVSLEKIA